MLQERTAGHGYSGSRTCFLRGFCRISDPQHCDRGHRGMLLNEFPTQSRSSLVGSFKQLEMKRQVKGEIIKGDFSASPPPHLSECHPGKPPSPPGAKVALAFAMCRTPLRPSSLSAPTFEQGTVRALNVDFSEEAVADCLRHLPSPRRLDRLLFSNHRIRALPFGDPPLRGIPTLCFAPGSHWTLGGAVW